ncbi:MAG: hypothetical protein P9X22_08640 [Candidatus Zapsychrus exili]|nr:hypothetical protein [Candidatus Zapsychrus exili]
MNIVKKPFLNIFRILFVIVILSAINLNLAFAKTTNFSVSKIDKLRADINDKRVECKLDAYTWNDAELAPGITPVRATHMKDLREAIVEVYELPPLNGTYGYADVNMTMMKESHIEEIQTALDGATCCGDGTCDVVENSSNCAADCIEVQVPETLAAIAGGGRWIELAWKAAFYSEELKYIFVLQKSNSSTFSPLITSISTTRSLVRDTDISYRVKYYYRVRLEINLDSGNQSVSDWSNVVSATACIEGLLWDGNSCESICETECVGYIDEGSCPNCNSPFTVPYEDLYGCNGPCGCDCRPASGYSMLCSDYSVKNCPTSDGCSLDCAGSATASCGDGLSEVPEECDNGRNNGKPCNPSGGTCTYCSDTCTIIEVSMPCNDDNIIDDDEECDNGRSNGTACEPAYDKICEYCSSACKIVEVIGPYCGDGICNDEDENSSTCSVDCQETCGNGTIDSGEECDGNESPCVPPYDGSCEYCSNCSLETVTGSYCGDGTCNSGNETSNTCSADCAAVCGDDVINHGE